MTISFVLHQKVLHDDIAHHTSVVLVRLYSKCAKDGTREVMETEWVKNPNQVCHPLNIAKRSMNSPDASGKSPVILMSSPVVGELKT
jgi:hypothetical protein